MSGLTEAQKARRLGKVTASTAAGLLGYLPYASPSQVWKAQMGIQPLKETLPMILGNLYEGVIGAAADLKLRNQEVYGVIPGAQHRHAYDRLEKPDSTPLAGHEDWFLCHPDGVYWTAKEMVQIKKHDGWLRDRYTPQGSENDNESVPLHELIQCQLELAAWSSQRGDDAAKWRICWLCVDMGDATGPRLYRIVKDRKLIAQLVRTLQDFWLEHMRPHAPQKPSDEGWVGNLNDPVATEKRWSDTKALFKMKLTPDDINAMPVVTFPAEAK